jgi:hypothetical protein
MMTPPHAATRDASIHRPTRGAERVNALSLAPEPLQADLRRLAYSPEWKDLKDGEHWAQLVLIRNHFRHPLFDDCPGLARAVSGLPSRVLDACLKRLGPGGFVHEHRDMTGAAPMGVVRLHVPIVTHPDVEFRVNGTRLFLRPGEAWILDTSYRHSVANKSAVERVHLVVDVEFDRSLQALLPRRDVRDRLHGVHFWLFCVFKGIAHLSDPRHLQRLVRSFVQQRFKGMSTLP